MWQIWPFSTRFSVLLHTTWIVWQFQDFLIHREIWTPNRETVSWYPNRESHGETVRVGRSAESAFTIWSTTSSTQVKLCMLIGNSKSHCFSILNISENKCFFSRCIVTWTAFKNGFQSDMHACLVNMFWEWVALLPELLYHNASLHIIWWSFTLFGSRKYTFPLFKINGNSKRERVSKTSGEEENHSERFFAQPQH